MGARVRVGTVSGPLTPFAPGFELWLAARGYSPSVDLPRSRGHGVDLGFKVGVGSDSAPATAGALSARAAVAGPHGSGTDRDGGVLGGPPFELGG